MIKFSPVKLWGTIVTTTIAIIGGVFAAISWLDATYASEADLVIKLEPLTSKVQQIENSKNQLIAEIRELRVDQLRSQIRQALRDRYQIRLLVAAGTVDEHDEERLQTLEFDLTDLKSRLKLLE